MANILKRVSIVILLVFLNSFNVNCNSKVEASFTREEILNEKYIVRWVPNFDDDIIEFNVKVETTGFIGFGISRQGNGMSGADIVIGGVYENGSSYFQDYHALSNSAPIPDASQDWNLTNFKQNSTHTELSFIRKFDTCDAQDSVINEDSVYFIWSFGNTDQIGYHGPNRSQYAVNILDPPMPPLNLSSFDKWPVTRRMAMPAADTSYWCTMHKRPTLEGKRHIIAFDAFLPDTNALKHSHHIVLSQCFAPAGSNPDDIFGPFIGFEGETCYDRPSIMPMDYCTRLFYVWAVGGKATLFPEHVGFPINEPGFESEYILMEVHYDNPEQLSNVTFETGITIYHTSELREQEAAMLLIGHQIFPSHIIPPRSEHYTTVGHCNPNCTRERLPATGIQAFNVLLHSHLAGRQIKLRQFRNGTELPWIANDDHYNFNFQQNRPLRNEITILPGDQLSTECVTNTMHTNNVTLAGLSTRHEMCETFIWYYPKKNFGSCSSMYLDFYKVVNQFGIDEFDVESDQNDPTVISPPQHANKTFSQVLNEFEWTQQIKDELEAELRYSLHYGACIGPEDNSQDLAAFIKTSQKFSIENNNIRKSQEGGQGKLHDDEWDDFLVAYPKIDEEYSPPNKCVN